MNERRKGYTVCPQCNSPLVCLEERKEGVFICCEVCKTDTPNMRADGTKIITFREFANEFNG
jgi:hypothetical protein